MKVEKARESSQFIKKTQTTKQQEKKLAYVLDVASKIISK